MLYRLFPPAEQIRYRREFRFFQCVYQLAVILIRKLILCDLYLGFRQFISSPLDHRID